MLGMLLSGGACLTVGFAVLPVGAIRLKRNARFLKHFHGPTSSFDGYVDERLRRRWRKGIGRIAAGASLLLVASPIFVSMIGLAAKGYGGALVYAPMALSGVTGIGAGVLIGSGIKIKRWEERYLKSYDAFRRRRQTEQAGVVFRGIGPMVLAKGLGGLGAAFAF